MQGGTSRRSFKRLSLSLGTVALMVFGVLIPMTGTALANHGGRTLNVTPEVSQNATGTNHVLTATLSAAADGTSGTIQIDFEVSGPGDPETTPGDTPATPDLECQIVSADIDCTVQYSSTVNGTDTIRGWIDHDGSNASVDADLAEDVDETTTPGDNTNEPDITDVVEKTWFSGLPAGAKLDCIGEDGNVNDFDVNPVDDPADDETYTCTLLTSSDDPVAGINIDAENKNGANDPDDSNAVGTADWDDQCTTDAAGTCDVTVSADEGEAGTAFICFWADADDDAEYDPAGSDDDGGDCGEARLTVDNDQTDVVRKDWEARALAEIDATPDFDVNQIGTSHTVTVTTYDQFGDPFGGVNFDIIVSGNNTGGADNRITSAAGTNTFTYTDTAGVGTDTIDVFVDEDDDDVSDGISDQSFKTWINEPATASDVEVDMEGCDGDVTDLTDATSWDDEAAPGNVVGGTHFVCASAVTAGGQVLWGHDITFTSTGSGGFVDPDTGDEVATLTVPIDGNTDYAEVELTSTVSGDQTITVTIDGQTDTGTKTWEAGNARNIDLTPDAASNNPGTIHQVSALVTDAFGNPVPGVDVDFTETGAGAFRTGGSTVTVQTGDDGIAIAETTTLATETGDQTITGEIDDATTDCGLDADDPNTGDPAGNCTDTVTKRWGPTCPGFEADGRNQIVGTSGHDVIRGTDDADIICGLGGKDTLRGAQGDDLIKGGAGDDLMKGGDGNDDLRGNKGPDAAYGNAGTDACKSAKIQKGCES